MLWLGERRRFATMTKQQRHHRRVRRVWPQVDVPASIYSSWRIFPQSAERSTARFERLLRQKEVLEAAYGRPLTWEPLLGRRACRIADYRDGAITRLSEHDAYMGFFLDAGERMRNALAAVQLPD
jgi:hypothetical protein